MGRKTDRLDPPRQHLLHLKFRTRSPRDDWFGPVLDRLALLAPVVFGWIPHAPLFQFERGNAQRLHVEPRSFNFAGNIGIARMNVMVSELLGGTTFQQTVEAATLRFRYTAICAIRSPIPRAISIRCSPFLRRNELLPEISRAPNWISDNNFEAAVPRSILAIPRLQSRPISSSSWMTDEVERTKGITRTPRPVGGFRARGQTTPDHGLTLSRRTG